MPDKLLAICFLAVIVTAIIMIMNIYSTIQFHSDHFDQKRDTIGQLLKTSCFITSGLAVVLSLLTYMIYNNSVVSPEDPKINTNRFTREREYRNPSPPSYEHGRTPPTTYRTTSSANDYHTKP